MKDEDPVLDAAIARLNELINDARQRGDDHANACALATAGLDARPSVRTVNIMRVARSGLALLANCDTGKGQQMQQNPRAALCFHWPLLSFQAIVEGAVCLLSDDDADALWSNLPREKALSRWASDPTEAGVDSAALQQNLNRYRQEFAWQTAPRAPAWRAFEVQPDRIDFWPSRRRHPRLRECYYRSLSEGWQLSHNLP